MLKVHFLNVGHGDCCVVEFPVDEGSRIAVIDINRSSDMDESSAEELFEALNLSKIDFLYAKQRVQTSSSTLIKKLEQRGYDIVLTDPLNFLEDLGVENVFRFISTHPHMDHLSGLYRLNEVFSMHNLWILKNDFSVDTEKLSDRQKLDWDFYTKYRDGGTADGITVIRPKEGEQAQFYADDGISILAPNKELIKESQDKENQNIMSYVLLINYGKCKIVLGGDAEQATWKYLHENHAEDLKNITILKAAHHGRDSGYYQPAVKLMSPTYTIVSVGKKPETDATNKYRQYSEHVWSTRWKGNITFECKKDGTVISKTQYDR